MTPELPFRDTVTFYETTIGDYGMDEYVEGNSVCIPGMLIQNIQHTHQNSQDGLTSTTVLHLPWEEDFIQENYGRIEGMIVSVTPFSAPTAIQYFRIGSVNIARDVLLDNEVRHVECTLEKIANFIHVS